jgi:hypothetical protein
VRKRLTKSRPIIALDAVPAVFDDDYIGKLAKEMPPNVDLNALGWWIREAASMFALDARVPTANQLHDEIDTLHAAAQRRRFEEVADLLDKLSPEASAMLSTLANPTVQNDVTARSRHSAVLPAPGDLRNEALRVDACNAVARLCRIGGQFVEGRSRPSGKSPVDRVFRPHLFAPKPQRNALRREAERHFVARLAAAWTQVTGQPPPCTARHRPDREQGPFTRFIRECLNRVGAKDADAVELINEMGRRRRQPG